MIEPCEESGSDHLPYYIDPLSGRIGTPVPWSSAWIPGGAITISSGSQLVARHERGALEVDILPEGVHSGDASGVVPSSFRILRPLLVALEDPASGAILPSELQDRDSRGARRSGSSCAEMLGDAVCSGFPWVEGMRPMDDDPVQLIRNRTWRPPWPLPARPVSPRWTVPAMCCVRVPR